MRYFALPLCCFFLAISPAWGAPAEARHLEWAATAFSQGDYEVAIVEYGLAISVNSKCFEAYLRRGIARQEKKDLDGALKDIDRSIELNPNSAEAYSARGYLQIDKGEMKAAIEDFNRAITRSPACAEAYWGRGAAREALEGKEAGMEDRRKAIAANPSMDRIIRERGMRSLRSKDPRAAMEILDLAIQLNPESSETILARAAARLTYGDLDGALADFNRAVSLNPKFAEALAKAQGFDESGLWHYGVIDTHNKEGDWILDNLDGLAMKWGQSVQLPDVASALAVTFVARATREASLAAWDRALADYVTVIALEPKNFRGYMGCGLVHLLQRQWKDARVDFGKASELNLRDRANRDYSEIFRWLATARMGEQETADRQLNDYLAARKNDIPEQRYSTFELLHRYYRCPVSYSSGVKGLSGYDWRTRICNYLLGRGQEDLVSVPASFDPKAEDVLRTEACYYTGVKQLLSGDRPAAEQSFRDCLARKQSRMWEYELAEVELKQP